MQKIEELAEKDALLYINKLGQVFKDIIYVYSEFSDVFAWEGLDQMPPEEVFARVFAGFNLTQVPDINPPKDFIIPKLNLQEIIKFVFKAAYKYAAGEHINSMYLSYFLKYVYIYKKLIIISHPGMEIANDTDLHKIISPSFAQNIILIDARRTLEYAWQEYLYNKKELSLSINTIMDIAKISHPGVLKNIKTGNLKATKVNNNWKISPQDAINYLKSRKDCPKWILDL